MQRTFYIGLHGGDGGEPEIGRAENKAAGYFRRFALFEEIGEVEGAAACALALPVVFDQILSVYPFVSGVALYGERAAKAPLFGAMAFPERVLVGPKDRLLFGEGSLRISESGSNPFGGLEVLRPPLVLPRPAATHHLPYSPLRVHRVYCSGAAGGIR